MGLGADRGLLTSERSTVMECSELGSRFEATKKPIRSEAGSATRCPTEVSYLTRLLPARRVDRIVVPRLMYWRRNRSRLDQYIVSGVPPARAVGWSRGDSNP